MAQTRRAWLAAVAASASLAGCVSDGDSDGDDGSGDGSSGDSTDGADGSSTDDGDDGTSDGTSDGGSTGGNGGSSDGDAGGAAITVETTEHPELGEILVDGEGTTLYMFDSDEQGSGASTCSGSCADNWPPLTIEGGDPMTSDNVDAEFTTFEREDGMQVAANGWPLYYWQGDSEPGDATGQGVNEVWWVLDPSGAPIRS